MSRLENNLGDYWQKGERKEEKARLFVTFSQRNKVVGLLARWTSSKGINSNDAKAIHGKWLESNNLEKIM